MQRPSRSLTVKGLRRQLAARPYRSARPVPPRIEVPPIQSIEEGLIELKQHREPVTPPARHHPQAPPPLQRRVRHNAPHSISSSSSSDSDDDVRAITQHLPRRRRSRRPQPAQILDIAEDDGQLPPRELDFSDLPRPRPRFLDDEPEFVCHNPPHDTSIIGECAICYEDLACNEAINMMCGHTFHAECANIWCRTSGGRSCPLCRSWMQQIRQLAVNFQRVLDRDQRVMQRIRDGLQEIIDLTQQE